jgi:hypothetical protein
MKPSKPKIFKVKDSDPETFCMAFSDSASADGMTTVFATEEELHNALGHEYSKAEIKVMIQEARGIER